MRPIFLTTVVLVVAVAGWGEVPTPPSDVPTAWAWYVSDSLGDPQKACSWYDQLSYPFTLAIRQEGNVSWEQLWKQKKEISLTRLVTDSTGEKLRQDVFRGGQIDQTLEWDPTTHRLSTWTEYRQGKAFQVHLLDWQGERLVSQTVRTSTGDFVEKDVLSYGLDGRLRRVERRALDGVVLDSAAWTWGPDGVVADQQNFSGATSLRVHEGPSKTIETLTTAIGQLFQRIWQTQTDGTQLETDLDTDGKVKTEKSYDERGRLVREVYPTQKPEAVKTWTYDKQGRLVSVLWVAGDQRSETSTEWNAEGRVILTTKNGLLESREVWKNDERVKEEAFSMGTKVWEEDYQNGKRYQTIFFDANGVVRVTKDPS